MDPSRLCAEFGTYPVRKLRELYWKHIVQPKLEPVNRLYEAQLELNNSLRNTLQLQTRMKNVRQDQIRYTRQRRVDAPELAEMESNLESDRKGIHETQARLSEHNRVVADLRAQLARLADPDVADSLSREELCKALGSKSVYSRELAWAQIQKDAPSEFRDPVTNKVFQAPPYMTSVGTTYALDTLRAHFKSGLSKAGHPLTLQKYYATLSDPANPHKQQAVLYIEPFVYRNTAVFMAFDSWLHERFGIGVASYSERQFPSTVRIGVDFAPESGRLVARDPKTKFEYSVSAWGVPWAGLGSSDLKIGEIYAVRKIKAARGWVHMLLAKDLVLAMLKNASAYLLRNVAILKWGPIRDTKITLTCTAQKAFLRVGARLIGEINMNAAFLRVGDQTQSDDDKKEGGGVPLDRCLSAMDFLNEAWTTLQNAGLIRRSEPIVDLLLRLTATNTPVTLSVRSDSLVGARS